MKYTICLFGGASDGISDNYRNAVFLLGCAIGSRGHKMIYGAGSSGVMGAAARGMDSVGGHIIGVTPRFMETFEPTYPCTTLIQTDTMSERKDIMEQQSDAFVIAPGGIGTFDEFFQVLTLTDVGRMRKPIILFNIDGYYDPLVNAIHHGIQCGFIRIEVLDMFHVCNTPEDILDIIEHRI